jgi:hypothetical protein
MVARIFAVHDEGAALHWIGAAVVSLWATIPHDLQESIVRRALAMAENDPDIDAQIKAFTKLNGERATAPPP